MVLLTQICKAIVCLSLSCTGIFFGFTMAQQPLGGQDLLIIEDSRSRSDTPQSGEIPWTSDQPEAGTST